MKKSLLAILNAAKDLNTYTIIICTFLLTFTSCDVHEWPEENHKRVPFLLHLNFNTEMPIHQEIFYSRSEGSKGAAYNHDIRYLIRIYNNEEGRGSSRVADSTVVITQSVLSGLNHTIPLELHEGTYTFRIWVDYVDTDSYTDKYYNTENFAEIILSDRENHSGSNDYREAFRGYATASVTHPADSNEENQVTIEMKRPMGKFQFISTDVDVFLHQVVESMRNRGLMQDEDSNSDSKAAYDKLLQSIHLGAYKVVFRYNAFMPCSFNMFTDKPADSWTGVSFTSQMKKSNNNEMILGHDYIFVNGSETTLSVSIEIYNAEGELMSSSNPIDVPIVRNKLTLVKGEFLTSKASGGVCINPSFDGEDYNIEIK